MTEADHVYTRLCPECAEKLNRIFRLNPHERTGDKLKRCELCKGVGYYLDYDYYTDTQRRNA